MRNGAQDSFIAREFAEHGVFKNERSRGHESSDDVDINATFRVDLNSSSDRANTRGMEAEVRLLLIFRGTRLSGFLQFRILDGEHGWLGRGGLCERGLLRIR